MTYMHRKLAPPWMLMAVVVALGSSLGLGSFSEKADAQAAPQSGFVGVVAEDVLAGDRHYRDSELSRMRASGVGLIRQTFDWARIERKRGRWSFGEYDAYVGALASRGIELLPILFNPPRFASSKPRRHAKRGTYPPRRASDMARFAQQLVRRYGPSGSYWRAHRKVPKRPIRSWQVWNEPNLPAYWPAGPNPKAYAKLLRTVGAAIKRVDRGAKVVAAGLPQSASTGMRFSSFVAGMYRARAKGTFDAFAIHPYAENVAGVMTSARQARRLLRRYGDSARPIWITEIGWASGGPSSRFTVGVDGQASRVGDVIRALAAMRTTLGIAGFVYYGWRDATPYRGGQDFWGLHTGLLTIEGRAKPAYASFKEAVAQIDR